MTPSVAGVTCWAGKWSLLILLSWKMEFGNKYQQIRAPSVDYELDNSPTKGMDEWCGGGRWACYRTNERMDGWVDGSGVARNFEWVILNCFFIFLFPSPFFLSLSVSQGRTAGESSAPATRHALVFLMSFLVFQMCKSNLFHHWGFAVIPNGCLAFQRGFANPFSSFTGHFYKFFPNGML